MNLSKKANFSASAGAEKRPRFPRLKSRGPIEALVCNQNDVKKLDAFPRLKSRGPIEAQEGGFADRDFLCISTAEKSWPH